MSGAAAVTAGIFYLVLGIVFALILWNWAKRDRRAEWSWAIAGLFFNIFALFAYKVTD